MKTKNLSKRLPNSTPESYARSRPGVKTSADPWHTVREYEKGCREGFAAALMITSHAGCRQHPETADLFTAIYGPDGLYLDARTGLFSSLLKRVSSQKRGIWKAIRLLRLSDNGVFRTLP